MSALEKVRTRLPTKHGQVPAAPSHPPLSMQPVEPTASDVGNLAIQDLIAGGLRAKLMVGGASDPEEREADALASSVTAGGGATPCACGGSCAKCSGGNGDGTIRRKADGKAAAAPPSVARAFRGKGRPLDSATRHRFETKFGTSLSHIRLHDDNRTASMAATIGARAFAAGNDIGFAKGEFSPNTNTGRQLLAHEISHVVLGHGGVRRMYDNWDYSPPEDDWTPRQHIDAALSGGGSHHINAVYDFSSATTPEKLKLISIVLKLGWVGPSDESALERIWASFGDQLVAVATSNAETTKLWVDSIDRGAELGNLPPVLAFARKVQERGVPIAKSILKQSETSLNSERIRYGLNRVSRPISDCLAGSCVHNTDTMASGVDTAGLAAAAKRLAVALREIKGLEKRRDHALEVKCDREANCFERDPRLAEQMEAELKQKYPPYNEARNEAEKQFPILMPYTQTANLSALESIATGSGDRAAETLNDVLFEKLANVTKVRNELDEDPALVWKLTPVLEATLVELGYSKESIQSGFIKARVDAIERDKGLIEMGLGLIALGLGLLAAIPTGGLSLVAAAGVVAAGVGAAGISGYLAYEHLQEYQFLHAAAGSDFDKARAISSEDPSLFWLALDIVGAVFDFAAAKSALKAFATSARELRAAKDAAEVAKGAEAVREAARVAGQPKELAEKIISSAERARGAETVEQTLKREVEAAVQSSTKELNAAEDVGRALPAVEPGGVHGVKALPGGRFAVCSDPCHLVREFFARELAENPEFEKRLLDLERRSTEAQVPVLNKIELDKVRAEAATLSGDLRNARQVRELTAVSAEQGARIAAMDRQMVARLAELDPAMAKHMLELAPDQLSKLGALSAEEFGKVAKLGKSGVTKLAQLEPQALAKFVKLEPDKLAYVMSLSGDAVDWLAKLPPNALEKIASAEIVSPFSLRKMAEKINAKTSMKDIDKAIKRAKRHEAQVAKAFEAAQTGDWSKIPDKASVGRHLGYEIEEIARAFGASGYANKVMHYSQLTKKAIADLQKAGGRVLITQGQLKGGKLRFDIALIDFDKKTFELIDLVPMAHGSHVEKTKQYMDELQKLLGKEFKPSGKEMRYVDAEGKVVDTLEESVVSGGKGGGTIRRKPDGGAAAAAPPSVARAFHGNGRPLDSATRNRFEPRFGTSLGHIRLHDDTRTASMAATIGARAFAAGNDIGFAKGELSPNTGAGRQLLAHEISHVVLGHGAQPALRRSPDPQAPLTLEALIRPDPPGFTDTELDNAYQKYRKGKDAPSDPRTWALNQATGRPRARLEKLLGPFYALHQQTGLSRPPVDVGTNILPAGYDPEQARRDLETLRSDPTAVMARLSNLINTPIENSQISAGHFNILQGNIAELLARPDMIKRLQQIREKNPDAQLYFGVKARVMLKNGQQSDPVLFSDAMVAAVRPGGLQIFWIAEVKSGAVGGVEAQEQIHRWIEGHSSFTIELILPGVARTFRLSDDDRGIVGLARAPRTIYAPRGAKFPTLASGHGTVRAPERVELTQSTEEMRFLARAVAQAIIQYQQAQRLLTAANANQVTSTPIASLEELQRPAVVRRLLAESSGNAMVAGRLFRVGFEGESIRITSLPMAPITAPRSDPLAQLAPAVTSLSRPPAAGQGLTAGLPPGNAVGVPQAGVVGPQVPMLPSVAAGAVPQLPGTTPAAGGGAGGGPGSPFVVPFQPPSAGIVPPNILNFTDRPIVVGGAVIPPSAAGPLKAGDLVVRGFTSSWAVVDIRTGQLIAGVLEGGTWYRVNSGKGVINLDMEGRVINVDTRPNLLIPEAAQPKPTEGPTGRGGPGGGAKGVAAGVGIIMVVNEILGPMGQALNQQRKNIAEGRAEISFWAQFGANPKFGVWNQNDRVPLGKDAEPDTAIFGSPSFPYVADIDVSGFRSTLPQMITNYRDFTLFIDLARTLGTITEEPAMPKFPTAEERRTLRNYYAIVNKYAGLNRIKHDITDVIQLVRDRTLGLLDEESRSTLRGWPAGERVHIFRLRQGSETPIFRSARGGQPIASGKQLMGDDPWVHPVGKSRSGGFWGWFRYGVSEDRVLVEPANADAARGAVVAVYPITQSIEDTLDEVKEGGRDIRERQPEDGTLESFVAGPDKDSARFGETRYYRMPEDRYNRTIAIGELKQFWVDEENLEPVAEKKVSEYADKPPANPQVKP